MKGELPFEKLFTDMGVDLLIVPEVSSVPKLQKAYRDIINKTPDHMKRFRKLAHQ